MTHVHQTWYLLVDGTQADPNDVAPDDDGVLRHKDGLAVAVHENGTPMSVGRSAVENKNAEAAQAGAEPAAAPVEPAPVAESEQAPAKEVKPAPPKRYKTRVAKAR